MSRVRTADDTKLHVKDWGSGRPVIMMHGWPLSADSWDDVSCALADAGFRAIAYDRRGFGRSAQPWQGYDYDTLADDLASVIEATGAKDATLIGFSMGGGEVARYLSRHAGRQVKQAALVASIVPYMLKTADNPNGVPEATFAEMAQAMKDDRAKFFTAFFDDFYAGGRGSPKVSDEVKHTSWQVAMQAGLKPTLACADAFAHTDFRPDLAAFRVPTLIIHGTADKTVPIDTSARPAAAAIKGSTLVEYDGAPHGLFATHKTRLIEDLLRFVRG